MATITRQPTSNTTPDGGLGGTAVTGASNTGHSSTLVSAPLGGSANKSCRWSGFANVTEPRSSVKLIFDWVQNGDVSNGTGNEFTVQYSINGGSNWNNVFSHVGFQGSASFNGETVVLSASQDLSQVQIRDNLATSSTAEETGVMTATVSSIRIEVETVSGNRVIMGGM